MIAVRQAPASAQRGPDDLVLEYSGKVVGMEVELHGPATVSDTFRDKQYQPGEEATHVMRFGFDDAQIFAEVLWTGWLQHVRWLEVKQIGFTDKKFWTPSNRSHCVVLPYDPGPDDDWRSVLAAHKGEVE